MAWPLGATLSILSGVLMAGLGAGLVVANPRKDWNRLFALFTVFWGAQIVAANTPRVTTSADAARLAGELSLAFLLPLYFFLAMFAAVFPRPRGPLASSPLAIAVLLAPATLALALLFVDAGTLLDGVQPHEGHYTMVWGPAFPVLGVAPLYGAFFYALFVMMRRLDHAESAIERKQISFVLAALALLVAYNVPSNLVAFGGAALGLGAAAEARPAEAIVLAGVMLAGLALLLVLSARLARRRDARPTLAGMALVLVAATAEAILSPEVILLGLVRIVSVALIVYAIARYQLFDIDLKVKHGAAVAAAVLGGLALAGACFVLLRHASWGPAVAAGAAVVSFLPLLRLSYRVADRVAPAVSKEGDHLYLRKLEVYRASVEDLVRRGGEPRAEDAWLAEQRLRLGLTERDHGIAVSLAASRVEPSAAPDLRPGGLVFGKYVIDSVLAEGGYGRVFVARDRILGRLVVIKELQARWRADPRVVRTFLQEARIAGELDHPNVVRVLAVEQHGQDHYIVMEHVPGGTLEERIAGGRLAPDETLRVARGVLEALAAAHAKGVVHRDVKPSNVLLGPRGEVKLADFGIAQLDAEPLDRTLSGLTTGSFHPGTLQYMSPEQAAGRPLDARSDLYAVGALLHRMATGRPHVDLAGLDEVSARHRITQAAPPAPVGVAWLDEVLARALAPDPHARYPTARDMLAAINRAVERGQEAPRGSTGA